MSPKSRSFSNREGLAIQHHKKCEFLTTFCVDRDLKPDRGTRPENAQAWMQPQHWSYFGNISTHSAALIFILWQKQAKVQRNNCWLLPCILYFRLENGIFWEEMGNRGCHLTICGVALDRKEHRGVGLMEAERDQVSEKWENHYVECLNNSTLTNFMEEEGLGYMEQLQMFEKINLRHL